MKLLALVLAITGSVAHAGDELQNAFEAAIQYCNNSSGFVNAYISEESAKNIDLVAAALQKASSVAGTEEVCVNTATLAYIDFSKADTVNICSYENFKSMELATQAEALIHEGAHLAGINDHCDIDAIVDLVMVFGAGTEPKLPKSCDK